eukprot:725738-Rhodomonas_salina.2
MPTHSTGHALRGCVRQLLCGQLRACCEDGWGSREEGAEWRRIKRDSRGLGNGRRGKKNTGNGRRDGRREGGEGKEGEREREEEVAHLEALLECMKYTESETDWARQIQTETG